MNDVNDFQGHIFIPSENKMHGKLELIPVENEDLQSSISVYQYSSMASSITVRRTKESDVLSGITIPLIDLLPSEINVARVGEGGIGGNIVVNPYGRMLGLVDVMEPPRVTIELEPIQDAFVRENVPTLNYGTEQTMLTGKHRDTQEEYRSFIHFDISSIPDNTIIEEALVRLYSNDIGEVSDVRIYSTVSPWTETGITWNNQPAVEELMLSGEVNIDEKYIEFDISDIANSWVDRSNINYGLSLRSLDNTVKFFTRESSVNRPVLELTYRDDVIYSYGRGNLNSNINVVGIDQQDLISHIHIPIIDEGAELVSNIVVRDPSTVFSGIVVTSPYIYSKLIVKQESEVNLASSVKIRQREIRDYSSFIAVSTPDKQAHVYVLFNSNLSSNLIVRRTDESEVYSTFISNARSRVGRIKVPYREDISSSILIRNEAEKRIQSSIVAIRTSVEGSIKILHRENLSSYITVRRADESNVESNLQIIRTFIKSNVTVLHRSNLNSSLVVRRTGTSTIGSSLQTMRTFVVSSIAVLQRDDLESSIVIRRFGEYDVDSSLAISKPILAGSLVVRRTKKASVDGLITVRRKKELDLSSSVAASIPEIQGIIKVILHNAVTGSIVVRKDDDSELGSETYVLHRSNLASKMLVVGASMIPSSIYVISGYLKSYIRVPEYKEDDIEGSMVVRVTWISEISSSIRVGGEEEYWGYVFII